MDTGSVIIFGVFCLVSAFVAVMADDLGRRLGKKRLTLFGMRPKNFARMTVFLAGFLIPLLTLGFGYLVSKDVRVILAKGAKAAQELEQKQLELGDVRGKLDKSNEDLKKQGEQIGQLQTTEKTLRTAESKLKSDIQKGRFDLVKLQKQNAGLNLQTRLLVAQAKLLRQSVEQMRGKVASVNAEYKTLQENTRGERGRFEKLQIEARDLGQRNVQLDLDIDAKQKELDAAKKLFQETSEQLNRALKGKEADLETARGELESARGDLERTQREIDRQRATVRTIQEALQAEATVSRTGSIIFSMGEELSRVKVPAGLSASEAGVHLTNALRAARQVAADRGAGQDRIGYSADFRLLTSDAGQTLTVDAQQQSILKQLTNSREMNVLLLNSFWNSFRGEPVWLVAGVRPNLVVYRPNSVVGEVILDGRDPRDKIILDLSAFLKNQVQTKAIASGMIAAQGREDLLGRLDTEALLKLIDDVRLAGRRIRVQAYVTKEIRAADTLDLEFRLR